MSILGRVKPGEGVVYGCVADEAVFINQLFHELEETRRRWHPCQIDCRHVNNASALFDQIAMGLRFPSYFGRNWDALDECVHDLAWLAPAGAALLLLLHADELALRMPDELRMLLEITSDKSIKDVAETMQSAYNSIPLATLVHTNHMEGRHLIPHKTEWIPPAGSPCE